jgi:hypothetical protein
MGKVISIGRSRAAATAEEREPFLLTDSFLPLTEELGLADVLDSDLYKRITYDMMESELSVPLLKPMWPLCSSF